MIQVPQLPTRCVDCRMCRALHFNKQIYRYRCRLAKFCGRALHEMDKAVYEAGAIPGWCPLYDAGMLIKRKK